MKGKLAIFGGVLAFVVIGAPIAVLGEVDRDFMRIEPADLHFKSPFGAGPETAVLFGDPSKPGIYVIRNRFPPGVHSFPHFHSKDRHVTVIKGVWWAGTGPELDFNKAKPLKAGSYMFHPAGGVHWDGANDEEVIVQVIGEGPVETTQIGGPPSGQGYWPKRQ